MDTTATCTDVFPVPLSASSPRAVGGGLPSTLVAGSRWASLATLAATVTVVVRMLTSMLEGGHMVVLEEAELR